MRYGIDCCARHVAKEGGDRTFSLLSTYVRLNHDWKRVHAEACLHPSCPSSFSVLPHLFSIRADLRYNTAGLCLHSWVAVDHVLCLCKCTCRGLETSCGGVCWGSHHLLRTTAPVLLTHGGVSFRYGHQSKYAVLLTVLSMCTGTEGCAVTGPPPLSLFLVCFLSQYYI